MQIFFSTEFYNSRAHYLYMLHKVTLYKAIKVHKKSSSVDFSSQNRTAI